jgi:hypothetical protein
MFAGVDSKPPKLNSQRSTPVVGASHEHKEQCLVRKSETKNTDLWTKDRSYDNEDLQPRTSKFAWSIGTQTNGRLRERTLS